MRGMLLVLVGRRQKLHMHIQRGSQLQRPRCWPPSKSDWYLTSKYCGARTGGLAAADTQEKDRSILVAARTPLRRCKSTVIATDLAGNMRRTIVWVRPGLASAVCRMPRDYPIRRVFLPPR